jgi:hypothetical protein
MIRRRTHVLLSAMLAVLVLPSMSVASPWALSVRAARGHIVGAPYLDPRLGLEADLLHAVNGFVWLGLECGWWEELGSYGFAYGAGGPGDPLEEHQREVRVGALIRLRGQLMYSRPYLLVGAGDYLTIRRDRYPAVRSVTRREHAPGLSVGVGVSGSTRPTPVLDARWHRFLTNSDPYDPTLKTTDILILSVGLSLN